MTADEQGPDTDAVLRRATDESPGELFKSLLLVCDALDHARTERDTALAEAFEHKAARAELNDRCTQYRERADRAEAERDTALAKLRRVADAAADLAEDWQMDYKEVEKQRDTALASRDRYREGFNSSELLRQAAVTELVAVTAERDEHVRAHNAMAVQFEIMQREKEHGWREAEEWETRAETAQAAVVTARRDALLEAADEINAADNMPAFEAWLRLRARASTQTPAGRSGDEGSPTRTVLGTRDRDASCRSQAVGEPADWISDFDDEDK